ncbi:hypothetical protein QR680_006332 [Steinernema hermaphroditum]|uniref:TIL domain-containing protein n=1 Tax=Steinernema hermaphroditum TaxID=289476 RepID=A0AA39HWK5_9BILA|nr:hypothetical protein QR680_006332 [Steinernema hermaphroditum]
MFTTAAVLCALFVATLADSELPAEQPKCGINEVFYECGACDSTCWDDFNCNSRCRKPGSCGCKPTYKRNKRGVCIPPEQCPKPKCGRNEEFFMCGACDKSCSDLRPECTEICRLYGDCGCKKGFVRNGYGDCVTYRECRRRG